LFATIILQLLKSKYNAIFLIRSKISKLAVFHVLQKLIAKISGYIEMILAVLAALSVTLARLPIQLKIGSKLIFIFKINCCF